MLVEVYNSYHNTTEIMEGTLSQVKKQVEELMEIKASELAINELEEDWEKYYQSKDQALKATYNDIYEALCSEFEYEEIN